MSVISFSRPAGSSVDQSATADALPLISTLSREIGAQHVPSAPDLLVKEAEIAARSMSDRRQAGAPWMRHGLRAVVHGKRYTKKLLVPEPFGRLTGLLHRQESWQQVLNLRTDS